MPITISQIKAIRPWLAEARYAWLSVGVIFVALAISIRPNTPEPVIRLTGLVLQILGIATVIWGISETRAFFGHPSFSAKFKLWLMRFPLRRQDSVIGVGSASFSLIVGKARGHSTHDPGTNPTIEDRIASLERNIYLIHERITGTQKEIDDEFRKVSDALKIEERERQREDDSLHNKLEATGTGGVHISAIGASWLFVGVILSTTSLEIADLLK